MLTNCRVALGFLLLFSSTAAAQKKEPAPIALTIAVKQSENPLKNTYCTVELKNGGDKPMEIWSNLPAAAMSYVDVSVINEKGTRISQEFYRAFISSPFADPRLCATILAGKSLAIPIDLFDGIDSADLKPGKYQCRVRFLYRDAKLDKSTEEIEVELTQDHIDKRKK